MKKLTFLLAVSLIAIPLSAQFKAKMHFTTMGQDRVFTIYSSDLGYRYEFNENGQEGAIIVKKGSKDVLILMPQQKMAMKSSASDPMSMGNDPLAAFDHYKNEGNLMKEEGEEIVNGVKCKKSSLWNKDNPTQKMFTIWLSDKYDFPIKMINHTDGSSGDSVMELKDIEPWISNPKSFEIPAGYQLMDMPKY